MITLLASGGWGGRGWGGRGWDGGGGWWFGPLIPLLWLALVGLTVWLITRRRRPHEPTGMERARHLLAERYAQGELSADEYRERLGNLQ
ncbi:MAG: SHOCT domain-containing protein [Euzebyales bacterium]|nr:SHOCT domain-containing protein [Euzebyales bacterium]